MSELHTYLASFLTVVGAVGMSARQTLHKPWLLSLSYRNFLMACATLMDQKIQPLYFCFLDEPRAPGVRNVQYWIEDAWKQGLLSILW